MHGLIEDPVVDDAFGAALRACYEADVRPGVVFEIVERDDGFISGDIARYFAPVEDWRALERQAREEFTGQVLDLGCGAGRHASVLTAAVDTVVLFGNNLGLSGAPQQAPLMLAELARGRPHDRGLSLLGSIPTQPRTRSTSRTTTATASAAGWTAAGTTSTPGVGVVRLPVPLRAGIG